MTATRSFLVGLASFAATALAILLCHVDPLLA